VIAEAIVVDEGDGCPAAAAAVGIGRSERRMWGSRYVVG
jgi:hypothetical protein